jgi:hypothetical protein
LLTVALKMPKLTLGISLNLRRRVAKCLAAESFGEVIAVLGLVVTMAESHSTGPFVF